ncbi:MAG: hypothetical protein KIS96_04425 [Bauldia sp.]|nr:hypothetical protein [Bauldia sp.]
MTDFYNVLRSSLDRVGAQDSAERRRVYRHVRGVMLKQIEQLDPPLSTQAAEERMALFDAAVERIEDEIAHALDPAPSPPAVPAAAEAALVASVADADVAGASPVANPDAVWDAPAIDMAWDAATEQWHDSAQGPPPVVEPPLPGGEWSTRLRVALAEERGYLSGDPVAEPEPDVEPLVDDPDFEPELEDAQAEPVADPLEEPERRGRGWRSLGGAAAERLAAGLARRAARAGRNEPFEPRLDGPAGMGVASPPPPPPDPPIGLIEDRSLRADDRSGHAEGDPFGELYEDTPRRGRRSRRDDDDAIFEGDDGLAEALEPRRPVRRLVTIGLAILGIAILGWGAYVFVPLVFSGGEPGSATVAEGGSGLVVFNGEDPSVFVSGPDNPVQYLTDDTGPFVRIASAASNPGARATIGRGIAGGLGDRQIVVTVNARGAPAQAAATLRFGYLRDNQILGWRTVNITTEFQSLGIAWDVPAGGGGGEDYLLIEPGIPGDGTAVDVRSIRIEPID